ncbi:MAG: MotA/TolQ/ExbB proton channel family protein [Bacteroidota bacterium]
MSKTKKASGTSNLMSTLRSMFATSTILISLVIAFLIFKYIMGNPINFEGGNPEGKPMPGNYLGMIYSGGYIVPILITLILVLFTFSIERAVTIHRARGKGKINVFVKQLQVLLNAGQINEAIAACDVQKGSLGNVMKTGLNRYKELEADATLEKDQKLIALQQSFEEATALELPMLSKNLVILSTIASIAVLFGLLGTVLGMIRAFAALAQAGAPDALALATGISEALINTAFGIGGSTVAIILYNYFSTKIDAFTYKIDEAGYSLVQTFNANVKR